MAKETYFFSHDYNARNDRKIAALVKDYKSAGYGIFWATCEMMHEEGGTLEFDDMTLGAIAKDLNEEPGLISIVLEKCISVYKLFVKQEDLLQSSRVHRNLDMKNEKKNIKAEAGRLGGIKSGESRRNSQNGYEFTKQNEAVLQPASSNEAKESKGDYSKGNEIKESKEPASPWFDLKLDIPEKTMESAELNQFTFTGKKNTEFIKCQWKVFLSERLDDPPEKSMQHKKVTDLTSYFLNWLRPKMPKINGKGEHITNSESHTNSNGKLGTSAARVQRAKNW